MPEAKFALSYPVEPLKRPPIIKVSCGIGDTDGFPAFDVESDNYAAPNDPKWGFRITGGAEFHMPITVFQVTDGGLADQGGIRLGDIIVEINETDVTNLPLAKVQEIIDSSAKKIYIIARGMEDEEMNEEPQEEEKSIVLRVPKPLPPPKEFTPTPLLGTRVWHPIMWQEPPAPPKEKKHKTKVEIVNGEEVVIELSEEESSDEEEEELPHHRIIRNIRRFFTENKNNEDLRSRTIEDMLLILPASIEERLREMQRKLSEIAEIPKILSSTLETVSQTFEKFLPPEPKFRETETYESDDLDSVSDDNDEILSDPDSLELENKYKDLTPESDYVSETNDDDDDDDDDDIQQIDDNEDESDDDQQYTWNLSNVPEVNIEETEDEREPTAEELFKQEKQEKIEKLERSWPWADREKIIYKQSTCHLVPRQPLGIVEDRIKLLARRNIAALYERKQFEN